jgi:hypothetical protein
VFLGRSIARDWPRVRAFPWQPNLPVLGLSVLALVGVLGFGVFVWSLVLRRFEHPRVAFATLLRIWFLSNLARYIPGTVFQFLTAAQLSRSAGLSAAVLITSLLVHTGVTLLAALVLAACTLGGPLLPGIPLGWLAGGCLLLALLLVHPWVLNTAIGVVPRLLRKPVLRWSGSWGYGAGLLLVAVASWLLYGGAYYLFLRSLTPLPVERLPVLSGINALSFLVGYVVIIAPAGIGFRETAMQRLLLPLLPAGVAGVISIAARLWNVAGELLGGALVLLFTRSPALPPPAAEEAARPLEASPS